MRGRRGAWLVAPILLAVGVYGQARGEAVEEAIAASEYAISLQPEGYQAPNRAQGFRTFFLDDGIRAVPRAETEPEQAWEWGLSWIGCGRGELSAPVPAAALGSEANRIEYRRGAHTEWYENGPRGLKQGFVLAAPPSGEGGLVHLDLALTGTLSPVISQDGQAIDFVSGTGVRILRYAELRVTDARDREVPAWMEGFVRDGVRGIKIVLDDRDAVYPLTVDPLATSPAWTKESDQALAEFGRMVATAGDVNGDGFSDLLVAAPFFDNGNTDEGRAFLFLGSASGLALSPAWTAESDQNNARFGIGLATAGDVNGDGYSDVIVGAPLYDGPETDEGRVYVYLGSALGLAAAPAWTKDSNQASARFGTSVGTAGDVNGDGFSDVIVGAPLYDNPETDEGKAFVYLGSASGLAANPVWTAERDQASAQFGWAVATAGDANGDGFADVIVGAPLYDNGQTDEGRAFLYYGTASGVAANSSWLVESDQAGAQMGWSVGTAGDVVGDGCADLIVGAWQYTNTLSHQGRAFVFLSNTAGPSSFPIWTGEADRADAYYGWSVGTAGDVNGDGFADIVVSAAFYFLSASVGGGQAYVYFGSPSGIDPAPEWSVMRQLANAAYGYSVATAGDVDGDGYADVVVGAPWDENGGQTNEGIVYLYRGSAGTLTTTPAWTDPNQAAAHLGWAVASAGDVNGDGYGDVVAGAPDYNTTFSNAGKAYLYLGSATSILATTWSPEGTQVDAAMGWAVASAGDVNGDGYGDVLVGTPLWDAPQGEDCGKAELYLGSPTGLSATPAWTKEGAGFDFRLGTSLGTAGDVNGDGFADVIIGVPHNVMGTAGGQAFVYLGSASGLPATQWWVAATAQPDEFGYSVGTAGDVNGDGYSDVVVGAPSFTGGQQYEGRAFLYLGGPEPLTGGPAWMVESNVATAFFGASIAGAGDVNGDGYSDVIVGVPGNSSSHVKIFLGSAAGLSTTPAQTILKTAWNGSSGSDFGLSVGSAGDVNGDGFADVVIGSPLHVVFGATTAYGHMLVGLGSATGITPTPFFDDSDGQDDAEFGRAVASAGDLNGDGYGDVVVGSPYNTHGETQEGRVYFYRGNSEVMLGGLALNPRQRRASDTAPVARLGASDATNIFRLAALGRTPFGRGKAKLEWEVRRLGTALTGTPTGSGSFVDTDVDGGPLAAAIGGLLPSTPYHWRVRLKYDPASVPFAPRSRWFTVPWGGHNEAMLRTAATSAGAGNVLGLTMSKLGPNVFLSWGASCVGTDVDYEVYEGTLGSFTSHVPIVCTTGGVRTHSLTPVAGNRYYLVVPSNGTSEGSYGRGVANAERPASASACRSRVIAACP